MATPALKPKMIDILAQYRKDLKILTEAEAMAQKIGMKVSTGYDYEDPRLKLKQAAWKEITQVFDLSAIMPHEKYEELSSALHEQRRDRLPDLTESNVMETVMGWVNSSGTFRHQILLNAYNQLRPHYTRLKTNRNPVIGQKAIVHLGEYPSTAARTLDKIEHALCVLDGRRMPESGRRASYKAYGFYGRGENKTDQFESEWFDAKFYKNGNCHLRFKRMDLIEKLNQEAGEGRVEEVA